MTPIELAQTILDWAKCPTPTLERAIVREIRRHRQSYYLPGVVEIRYVNGPELPEPLVTLRRIGEGLMYG